MDIATVTGRQELACVGRMLKVITVISVLLITGTMVRREVAILVTVTQITPWEVTATW